MGVMEDRWVIMKNEDESSTFTHALLDKGKDGAHHVRFGVRSLSDCALLIEALSMREAMEHGFMPAVVIDRAPQKSAKTPRPRPSRGKEPRKR